MSNSFYEVLYRKSLKDTEKVKDELKMYRELYENLLKDYSDLEDKYNVLIELRKKNGN